MRHKAAAPGHVDSTSPLAPWSVEETAYPFAGEPWEKLSFCLNYAILAPSSHNTQPWRFKLEPDQIKLFADVSRTLPVIDPHRRELIMSCGAALFHLRLAIRYFGHTDEVVTFPEQDDPELVAILQTGCPRPTTAHERSMFENIIRRHTNRFPFDSRPIPPQVVEILQDEASREEARFIPFADPADRRLIAQLVSQGDAAQLRDPAFRQELAAWIHSADSLRHDGIPGYACGPPLLPEFATPLYALAVRTLDISKRTAQHDRDLVEASPLLGVITTATDTREAWLAVGQALARVLLIGCAYGLSASFLNQPVQSTHLRSQLRETLWIEGFPQAALRLGYGPSVKPTPRRNVRDFLI
jgi:nitroreductase